MRVEAIMPSMACIPLSAFRVPDGKIAMTLMLSGMRCVTGVIGVADLDFHLNAFEAGMELETADRANPHTHAQMRELLRQHMERADDADMRVCVAAAFWLALKHPHGGVTMRAQVAAFMKVQNRAQITITSDRRQLWSFAVSERPVMTEAIMAAIPVGPTVCLTFPERADASLSRLSQAH